MQLTRRITPDRPLLVCGLEEEAQHLRTSLPVLVTGLGKVNAATALADTLARGPLPSEVVNLGTAGALRPGWSGTHQVGFVFQHDFNSPALLALTGVAWGGPLKVGDGEGPTLATGDSFIAADADRERLAEHAALVDMEGYALVAAARGAGVGVRIVKHVSDNAGDGAAKSWRDGVADCARVLADWAQRNVATYI